MSTPPYGVAVRVAAKITQTRRRPVTAVANPARGILDGQPAKVQVFVWSGLKRSPGWCGFRVHHQPDRITVTVWGHWGVNVKAAYPPNRYTVSALMLLLTTVGLPTPVEIPPS